MLNFFVELMLFEKLASARADCSNETYHSVADCMRHYVLSLGRHIFHCRSSQDLSPVLRTVLQTPSVAVILIRNPGQPDGTRSGHRTQRKERRGGRGA